MCFRIRWWDFKVIAVFVLLSMILACADENRPYSEVPELLGKGYCLSSASEDMRKYGKGELAKEKLAAFWSCADDAVSRFLDYTKGRSEDRYTGAEIGRFLKRFFLGEDTDLTPELIFEFMELKRLFMGGSAEFVTRKELQDSKYLFKEFQALMLDLSPAMKIITHSLIAADGSQLPEYSPEEFNRGFQTLSNVADRFGRLLAQRAGHPYTFNNLTQLMSELARALGSRSDSVFYRLAEYIPVMSQSKVILLGPPQGAISPKQWSELLRSLVVLAESFARFNAFVRPVDWSINLGLDQMMVATNRVLDLFQLELEQRQTQEFALAELDELILALQGARLLPLGLKSTEVQSLLRVLINRLLAVNIDGEMLPPATGLSLSHFRNLRYEINFWRAAQEYLNSTMTFPFDLPRMAIPDPATDEMRRIMATPWPLVLDPQGRLVFRIHDPLAYDRASLTSLNWQRALVRVLVRAYAQDQDRRLNLTYVTDSELERMARDLAPLAEALGLYTSADFSIYRRIYFEGDTFMPRANGNALLEFEEAVEYLSFAWSGLNSVGPLFDRLTLECPVRDKDGVKSVDINCFRDKIFTWEDSFVNLPELETFLRKTDGSENWLSYERFLEKTVRSGSENSPLLMGDMVEMWVLMQYIETFYGRFDADRSSTLNLNEALNAYQAAYQGPLGVILGSEVGPEDVLALFTYMLKFGVTPMNDGKIGGSVRFYHWKWHPERWIFEANRMRLIQILASLNQNYSIWLQQLER